MTTAAHSRWPNRLAELALVAAFLMTFAALAFSFMRSTAPTFDENVYLPAGFTYLKWADYRIDPEHPPLVKKLAALPLFFKTIWPSRMEPEATDFSSSSYVSSERLLRLSWAIALKHPN